MSESKTPYELWAELRELVNGLEKDAQKATRGMKAGGVRLRALLQEVREHCAHMRKSVLEHRTKRIERPDAPAGAPETNGHTPNLANGASPANTSGGFGASDRRASSDSLSRGTIGHEAVPRSA